MKCCCKFVLGVWLFVCILCVFLIMIVSVVVGFVVLVSDDVCLSGGSW